MRLVAAALAALALGTAACGPSDSEVVTVLAASSAGPLLEGRMSEDSRPIAVSLGGSQQLAAAVRSETPAGLGLDLLVLADQTLAAQLQDEFPELGAPIPWITTTLSVVAAADTDLPRDLGALLGHQEVTWVIASEGVPLGAATRAALGADFTRIEPLVVSLEDSAGSVLAKVASGEVDVAVVYSANAAGAIQRGELQVLHAFGPEHAVVVVLQPVTREGRELADVLLADVAAIRRAGFEPVA